MVLVDEKDTNVAKVYGILPVSKFWFTAFRLIPPFLLATLATFFLLLVEPFYGLPVISNLVYSALAGLIAPQMILFVATIAKNKIEAMTWQKLFNLPFFLPLLAFYVPASFSLFFAIFPTFWAYQGFNSLINGGTFWIYLLLGFAHSILLIILMIERFTRSHFK
jgi:fluoroquinolone transport system permease protein